MSIVIAGIIGICITLPMVLKFEEWLNKNDDFLEVEEWHNFQSRMGKK